VWGQETELHGRVVAPLLRIGEVPPSYQD